MRSSSRWRFYLVPFSRSQLLHKSHRPRRIALRSSPAATCMQPPLFSLTILASLYNRLSFRAQTLGPDQHTQNIDQFLCALHLKRVSVLSRCTKSHIQGEWTVQCAASTCPARPCRHFSEAEQSIFHREHTSGPPTWAQFQL